MYICAVRAKEDPTTPRGNGFAVTNCVKASREMPANATNRPIKTRRLKNADWEVDFFFIGGCRVDGFEDRVGLKSEALLLPEIGE